MTERRERFIDYYLQSGNASDAARKAGYAERSARITAAKLLANANVSSAIEERLKSMASERIAQTEEVMEHLTSVLRGQEKETVVTNSGKSFVVPVSEKDRIKAGEMILKVNGAFKDKLDVKVDGGQLFLQTMEKIFDEENV